MGWQVAGYRLQAYGRGDMVWWRSWGDVAGGLHEEKSSCMHRGVEAGKKQVGHVMRRMMAVVVIGGGGQ